MFGDDTFFKIRWMRMLERFERWGWLDRLDDKTFGEIQYYTIFGERLNLKNPQTLNQKLQWLKLYDRRSNYVTLADKYQVRNFVSDRIGEGYLVKLYGVYETFDEIDFDDLPSKFVLKPNHTSGDYFLCQDKSQINYGELGEKVNYWLNRDYFIKHREWPYKNIERKIICEEFLTGDDERGLLDYKFLCFNGEPKYVQIFSYRMAGRTMAFDTYDLDWNLTPYSGKTYKSTGTKMQKPDNLDEMIGLARKLAKDIPFVRVDFYNPQGKIFFGEMTLYPGAGTARFDPYEADEVYGKLLTLPNDISEEV